MPYKYVVPVNSKSFTEAPQFLMNGLNRLTWAGRETVSMLNKNRQKNNQTAQNEKYLEFNELLALGYMETQSIGVGSNSIGLHVVIVTDG